MAEYALIFILVAVTDLLGRWAFLPARYLPGNRARTLQVRLFLRLHPGKGFATIVGLHLRWGRLAALRRSRRIRPSLPLWLRALAPGEHCGVPRPGALAARPARPPGGARAGHGPAADGEDRIPGRRDPALPRPGHLHHHEGRRVRPDRRGPRAAGPGARVQPAAHRRRRLDVRVVAGRGVPGPGHGDPPGGRVRVRGLPRGRRGRHVLVIEGE